MELFARTSRTEVLKNVGQAYAVPDFSPMQISQSLKSLKVSHVICTPYREAVWRTRKVSVGEDHGFKPVVCAGLESVFKFRATQQHHYLFVCDGRARLSSTNLPPLHFGPGQTLAQALADALEQPAGDGWTIQISDPGLTYFIDRASKPSMLRELQTLFYKITPYALRKTIQHSVLSYLAGKISRKAMNADLDKHHRGIEIKRVLRSESSQILLKALKEVSSGRPAQDVADDYNLDVFDLNYVLATTQQRKK